VLPVTSKEEASNITKVREELLLKNINASTSSIMSILKVSWTPLNVKSKLKTERQWKIDLIESVNPSMKDLAEKWRRDGIK
jgi:hypothetical protein